MKQQITQARFGDHDAAMVKHAADDRESVDKSTVEALRAENEDYKEALDELRSRLQVLERQASKSIEINHDQLETREAEDLKLALELSSHHNNENELLHVLDLSKREASQHDKELQHALDISRKSMHSEDEELQHALDISTKSALQHGGSSDEDEQLRIAMELSKHEASQHSTSRRSREQDELRMAMELSQSLHDNSAYDFNCSFHEYSTHTFATTMMDSCTSLNEESTFGESISALNTVSIEDEKEDEDFIRALSLSMLKRQSSIRRRGKKLDPELDMALKLSYQDKIELEFEEEKEIQQIKKAREMSLLSKKTQRKSVDQKNQLEKAEQEQVEQAIRLSTEQEELRKIQVLMLTQLKISQSDFEGSGGNLFKSSSSADADISSSVMRRRCGSDDYVAPPRLRRNVRPKSRNRNPRVLSRVFDSDDGYV